MASRRVPDEPTKPRRPPAINPEAREQKVIAAAYDLAEKQINEGTASSQVISHFLKLGSTREKLEQERLARENDLLVSKIEGMKSAAKVEELMSEALNAFRSYSPDGGGESFDY